MWIGKKGDGGGQGFWALFPSFPTENTHSRITIIWTICKIKNFQEHCYIGGFQAKLKNSTGEQGMTPAQIYNTVKKDFWQQ